MEKEGNGKKMKEEERRWNGRNDGGRREVVGRENDQRKGQK